MISLRPYQSAAVEAVYRHLRDHDDNPVVVIPTGGGKTEAYLGLTAYTLGLRRLQGEIAGRPAEYGVAVLMRYTLRLLTLQQYQRASTLICACESIRRERVATGDQRLGAEQFRIGLWVGQRTTPNTTAQSEECIKQDHGHYSKGSMAAGSGSGWL